MINDFKKNTRNYDSQQMLFIKQFMCSIVICKNVEEEINGYKWMKDVLVVQYL